MSARDDVDKRNIIITKQVLKNHPSILSDYINSLTNKTSYTKMVYARYVGYFLDYIKNECKINTSKTVNYTKIKPMNINTYIETIKYLNNGEEKSTSYINVQLAAIKGFFEFLEDNNIIDKSPCKKIKPLKDKKIHEIITITQEDYDIMINNIKAGTGNHRARAMQKKWINRDIALLTLGITTGLRLSAIVGIDINDIDFTNKIVSIIEKGDQERKVILGDQAIMAISNWINDRKNMVNEKEKALFICKTGKRISTVAVEERFRQIAEGTGKSITPHKMRATCATTLYEHTGDIYLVQAQLGHKNIENTKRYAKVNDTKLKAAADILNKAF